MGEASPAARSAVIDGMLLALSHSKLQPLASNNAVRAVLHIDYAELVKDGAIDLQGLWSLLAEEPGFDAEAAVAPMCTLKSWSEHFGMEVELPEHLRSLSDREIALKTTECSVPSKEVRKVFDAAPRRARVTAAIATEVTFDGLAPAPGARAATWRDNPLVAWVAGGVLLLAAVVLAVTLVGEFSSTEWQAVSPGQHVVGIPVVSAHKFGTQVGAVLDDAGWLARPDEERRAHMEDTLRGLDSLGIDTFFVKDGTGRIRATAQWFDNHTRIAVQFR